MLARPLRVSDPWCLLKALAAPTGKAADRMREAVEAAADHLPATLPEKTKATLKTVAANASTLHRLLGFNPSTGQCRANATQKLRSDVVIIDECSMIDTLLWQALLAALEPNTRLVLVGDQFDSLNPEAHRTDTLRPERRTALTSSTVTGKIDVRPWQSAAASSPKG